MITQTHFRSVVLTETGPVFQEELLELPQYGFFVVLKPILVGVCSSDVKEVSGIRPHRYDFGHEIVGTVVLTNLRNSLQVGDRVVYDPHVKLTRNSGFSELVVAESGQQFLANAFVKVAESFSVDKLVFLEPMACILHAYCNLKAALPDFPKWDFSLGIVGAGNAGAMAALYAKQLGVGVTLINRSRERLDFLQDVRALLPNEMAVYNDLGKNCFDIVLLATSFLSQDVLRLGLNIVKNNGTILLYGGTTPDTAIANANLDDIRRNQKQTRIKWAGKDLTFVGTHGALQSDFLLAYNALRRPVSFPLERLITRRVSLEQLPDLLRTMSRNPDHCIGKTVVSLQ